MPDQPPPPESRPTTAPQEKKDEPRPAPDARPRTSERTPLDLRVRTVRHEHDASGGH